MFFFSALAFTAGVYSLQLLAESDSEVRFYTELTCNLTQLYHVLEVSLYSRPEKPTTLGWFRLQSYILFEITEFLDIVHRLRFQKNGMFQKLEAPSQLDPLDRSSLSHGSGDWDWQYLTDQTE